MKEDRDRDRDRIPLARFRIKMCTDRYKVPIHDCFCPYYFWRGRAELRGKERLGCYCLSHMTLLPRRCYYTKLKIEERNTRYLTV